LNKGHEHERINITKTVGFVEMETNEMMKMNGSSSNNREQKAQQAKLLTEWANTTQDRIVPNT